MRAWLRQTGLTDSMLTATYYPGLSKAVPAVADRLLQLADAGEDEKTQEKTQAVVQMLAGNVLLDRLSSGVQMWDDMRHTAGPGLDFFALNLTDQELLQP